MFGFLFVLGSHSCQAWQRGKMVLFRRRTRTRRKGLVLLALLCISSSALVRIVFKGEKIYQNYLHQSAVRGQSGVQLKSINLSSIKGSLSRLTSLPSIVATQRHNTCSDRNCLNVLSSFDHSIYNQCTSSALRRGQLHDDSCQFIDGTNRKPIALASFPGSGNTWVRGLLQKVTGICTGSLYCDRDLRCHGFLGEGIFSGSVLVTKTHKTNNKNVKRNQMNNPRVNFTRAILIVRNPFDAIVSERNRQILHHGSRNQSVAMFNSSHVDSIGENYFGQNKEWNHFVNSRISKWKKMIAFWLVDWEHPVIVVTYERLKQKTSYEIKKILDFIGLQELSLQEIQTRLGQGYSSYQRHHHGNFTYYTSQQISAINEHIHQTGSILTIYNKTNLLSLQSYLKK